MKPEEKISFLAIGLVIFGIVLHFLGVPKEMALIPPAIACLIWVGFLIRSCYNGIKGIVTVYKVDREGFWGCVWGLIALIQWAIVFLSVMNFLQYGIFHDFVNYSEDGAPSNPYIIPTIIFFVLFWSARKSYKEYQDNVEKRNKVEREKYWAELDS